MIANSMTSTKKIMDNQILLKLQNHIISRSLVHARKQSTSNKNYAIDTLYKSSYSFTDSWVQCTAPE